MGDLWGSEKLFPLKNFSKGVSCVITNTPKGEKLLHQISDRIKTKPVPVQFILKNNASWPAAYNTKRVTLIRDIVHEPDNTEKILRKARWNT